MVMYEFQVTKFEAFRPKLEELIKEGKLAGYMRERLLVNTSDFSKAPFPLTNTTPPLDFEYKEGGYEEPTVIFEHLSGRRPLSKEGKMGVYRKEIDGAARTLLRQLKEDSEIARNGAYVNRLAFYLQPGIDHESNEISLDLLLTKGRPIVKEPYFHEDGELAILYLFMHSYDANVFPEEKKNVTLELLSSYIKQDYGGLALLAGLTLSRIDYKECIKMLPQIMDKTESPHHFTLAWSLVQRYEPSVLAKDLWENLDEKQIRYFIEALRFSSGDFKNEKANEFLKEVTKRIVQ